MRPSRSCSDSRGPSRPRSLEAGGVTARRASARQVRPPARRRLARGELGAADARSRIDPIAVPELERRARRRRPRRRRQAGRRRRASLTRLERADGRRGARRRRVPDLDLGRRRACRARAPARRRHERAHGRREVRARVRGAQARSSTTARSRRSTTRSCRAIPIRSPARSTRRSGGIRARTGSSRSPPTASTRSRTTRPSRRSRTPRLLEVHLETGRTHQIRVHMAAQRHPCVGDADVRRRPDAVGQARPRRGSGCMPKQLALHAPGHGGVDTFESEYPAISRGALEALRAD